jgi:uncharacterized protein
MQKMWCLTIRIKRNDEFRGKRLEKALIDFLMGAKISGATVWTGIDGFGKRGRSIMRFRRNNHQYAYDYRSDR